MSVIFDMEEFCSVAIGKLKTGVFVSRLVLLGFISRLP